MSDLPPKITNGDGSPTLEFIVFMEELVAGSGANGPSLGTLLSGVTAAQAKADGIQAGTVSLEKVVIDGRGDLSGELDAINGNVSSVAASASAGALSAAISAPYAVGGATAGGPGTTSPASVVTASGGTPTYTYAWAKVSGSTLTVNSPTAASTTFTGTPGVNSTLNAIYRCTVTDSAGSPATATADVSVSIIDFT